MSVDQSAPPPAAPTRPRGTGGLLRPLVLRIHFWAGVVVGPFLLVAALDRVRVHAHAVAGAGGLPRRADGARVGRAGPARRPGAGRDGRDARHRAACRAPRTDTDRHHPGDRERPHPARVVLPDRVRRPAHRRARRGARDLRLRAGDAAARLVRPAAPHPAPRRARAALHRAGRVVALGARARRPHALDRARPPAPEGTRVGPARAPRLGRQAGAAAVVARRRRALGVGRAALPLGHRPDVVDLRGREHRRPARAALVGDPRARRRAPRGARGPATPVTPTTRRWRRPPPRRPRCRSTSPPARPPTSASTGWSRSRRARSPARRPP